VVTKAPVLLQAVAPAYPPAALAAGKQADVPVRIHIDDTGLVTAVDVITPVGDGFDEAAVAAAMQYIFDPAEIDGVPAAIVVETTIHFVIEDEPPPPELPPPTDGDAGAGPGDDAASWPEAPPGHGGDPRKPITLEGEVVERGTRSKLAGVIVSIVQLQLDTVTDADGHFWFHGVPAGDWDVLAVADRYDRLERRVAIGTGEAVEVRLWMRPRGGNPYETIVEGEREQLEVTRRTLERRQLTSVPGTFGDPVRVIQALPGVARSPFGLGVLLIRGSNPDDTGIYLDGHRVPLLFHFLGGPSFLNPEFVDSIDLYPSGFPARFGRAHGGVVSIESRPSKADGVHGSADVDLLDASGYVRAPITDRLSVAVAGRRSYLDAFLGAVLPEPDPGSQLIVVPIYWDWQARADLDLGKEGRASLFAIGSSDRLDVLSVDAEQEQDLALDTAIDFMRVIGTYTRPLAGRLKLTLSPAWGRDTVRFASGQSGASPFLSADIVQDTLSYRLRVDGRLADHLTLDAGIDQESRITHYQALVPDDSNIRDSGGIDIPPSVLERSIDSFGLGLYADLAVDVGHLRLVPGLRVDGYVLAGEMKGSVDPRITARWRADPMWTLKGFLGEFHQPPQAEAADATFGNPDIGVERAIHVGAGAEWRPTRLWLADMEAYYIDRGDLVVYSPDGITNPDGTVSPANFVNGGDGFTYGFELMIKREITDSLYGWLTYTFSHTKRRFPGGDYQLSNLDQTHVANAVASWRPGGGYELGARWRMATGRPDTPFVDSTYDADSGGYAPVSGGFRSQRLPFFNQVDVRVEKTWLFDWWSLGVYLDVQNLLNTDNVEATQYDYRYRETSPVTGVPILPTIGIKGQW
ncbi:MAG: TonB family protein, partial [Myxococcales bacterium]|nr:TonB family protein [Myxococcales bacterium]